MMRIEIIEGNRLWLDGGGMFGNTPKSVWSRFFEADALNRIPLACRCLLVQTDEGKTLLFEAGTGNFFDLRMKERFAIFDEKNTLLDELARLGIAESDVDAVILSHLHFDHAGGVLSGYQEGEKLQLLFPKAHYFVSKCHMERAKRPPLREKASFIPELPILLEESGRLILVDQESVENFGLPVRFFFSHGHTLAAMHAWIETDKGPYFIGADLIPGVPWVHLPVTMGYDRFPELVTEEKQKMLDLLIAEKGQLVFFHDPVTATALITQDEKGRYCSKK